MRFKALVLGTLLASSVAFGATSAAQFSVFPGVQLGAGKTDSVNGFSLNLLGAENQNVSGLDLSLIGYRKVNGDFSGVHLSLFFEVFRVEGNMKGISFSLWNDIEGNANGGTLGLVNTVSGSSTFQFGVLNMVGNDALVQLGFINYAKNVSGIQFGFINATKHLEGLQVGLINYAENGFLPVFPIVNFKKTLF